VASWKQGKNKDVPVKGMKTCGSGAVALLVVNLDIDGGERSASALAVYPRRKAGTYLTGGRMGSRGDLEALEKKKVHCHCRKPTHNPSVVQPMASSLCRSCYPRSTFLNNTKNKYFFLRE